MGISAQETSVKIKDMVKKYNTVILTKIQIVTLSGRERLRESFLNMVLTHLKEDHNISGLSEDLDNSRVIFSKTGRLFRRMSNGTICTESRTLRFDVFNEYV